MAPAGAPEPLVTSAAAAEALVGACLDACASNQPKPLRAAGAAALAQAASAAAGPALQKLVLPALLARAAHKNKDVAERAVTSAEAAMQLVAPKVRVVTPPPGGGGVPC